MAAPTIPNGEEHCFVITYEGNGGGQRVGKFVPFTDNGTIANSLIFNDGDSPYMRRTPSGAGNRKTFTISFWVKRCQLGVLQVICTQGTDHNNATVISFDTSNRFKFSHNDSGSATYTVTTNRTFEDTSKFYHLLASVDTTQSTASDRVKLYVDGDLVTSFASSSYPSQDFDLDFNSTGTIAVSGQIPSGTLFPFDGYLTEINLVDGSALTPDTFGLTDTSTGRWIPKALTGITYGTNGFRLQFGTSSALGDDTSGNTNDFGTVSGLVAGDQTTDSPTQNHATMNPNNKASTNASLSEGNLTVTQSNTYGGACAGMALPSSGKYYWEIKSVGTMDGNTIVGIVPDNGVTIAGSGQFPGGSSNPDSFGFAPAQTSDAQTVRNSVFENCPTLSKTTAAGTYIQMCWDGDTGSLWFGLDDTFEGNPSAGTGASFTGINNTLKLFPACFAYADVFEFNFGQRSFQHTPPTGFVALQQDNLPETDKGIVGLTWIKDRDNAYSHGLRDSSRGRHKDIFSNLNQAEVTNTDGVQKFLKGGIQIEDLTGLNASGASIVAWNWVANGGTTASNGNGSISSTVQANTTAGFSIVQYTGNRSSGATIGHGLNQAPEVIITKNLDATYNWIIYFKQQGANKYGYLNLTNTWVTDTTGFNNVEPTSTVFTVGSAYESNGTQDMVAYCFHSVAGYSKMGNYIGNGVADGPFIYTGFKPRFIIHKGIDIASNGRLIDTARNPFNPVTQELYTDTTGVEYDMGARGTDFLSNGFKIRQESGYGMNNSGINYFYMAFAEHPFVGNGTSPVTAR